MYDWLHYFCGEWEGWALVNWFNHTSWVTAVTPTDRPKSVRNSCVIKVFGGVFMLSRCFLDCSMGVGVFVTGLSQISSFFSSTSWWVSLLIHHRPSRAHVVEFYCRNYQNYKHPWKGIIFRTSVRCTASYFVEMIWSPSHLIQCLALYMPSSNGTL